MNAPSAQVTAVVIDDAHADLTALLDTFAGATRPPDRVVVATWRGDEVSELLGRAGLGGRTTLTVVRVPVDSGLRTCLAAATSVIPHDDERTTWLWLLTPGARPALDALDQMLLTARRSTRVGIVVPKLRDSVTQELRSVGWALSTNGRLIQRTTPGEVDQGQHDSVVDLVGAPLPGLLVRYDVLRELAGVDPAFSDAAAGLDLGWRAQLAGHRVVLAPDAAVELADGHTESDRRHELDVRPTAPLRRLRARQAALAHAPWYEVPFRALWLVLSGVVLSVVMLLAKRPRHAWAELGDIRAVGTPWRVLQVRRRTAVAVPPQHLRGLFVRRSQVSRAILDVLGDSRPLRPASSTEHQSASSDWLSGLATALALMSVVAAGAAWWWRDLPAAQLLRGHQALTGDHLRPVFNNPGSLWEASVDGFASGGLGTTPAPPSTVLEFALARAVELLPWVTPERAVPAAVASLLLAAMPLAALSAYLSARVVTPRRLPRLMAGLLWAVMPPLLAAVSDGRVGGVVAHLLLPAVLGGAAHLTHQRSQTTTAAATVVAAAVLGAFAPPLLLLTTLLGVAVVFFGDRWHRLGGFGLAVLPWLLQGGWWRRAAADPGLLIPVDLTVASAELPSALRLAAGQPAGMSLGWQVALVPLVLVALLAAFRPVRKGTPTTFGAGLVALGTVMTVLSSRVAAGTDGLGRSLVLWPGLGQQLAGWGAVMLAVVAVTWVPARRAAAWRSAARLVTVVVGVGAGVTALIWPVPQHLTAVADLRPGLVVAAGKSPAASRVLTVDLGGSRPSYRLDGPESPPLVGLAAPRVPRVDASDPVAAAASSVLSPAATDLQARLVALGVSELALRSPGTVLTSRLDSVAGLTRVGEVDGLILWHVSAGAGLQPGRATVYDASRAPLQVVPAAGGRGRAQGTIPLGPSGRVLVVAEDASWTDGAQVRLDGAVLTPRMTDGLPTYALPLTGGELTITRQPLDPVSRSVQAVLAVAMLVLVLPLGRARREVRS